MGGFNQECTRPFRLIPRRWNNWFIRDRTGLLTCVLGLLYVPIRIASPSFPFSFTHFYCSFFMDVCACCLVKRSYSFVRSVAPATWTSLLVGIRRRRKRDRCFHVNSLRLSTSIGGRSAPVTVSLLPGLINPEPLDHSNSRNYRVRVSLR